MVAAVLGAMDTARVILRPAVIGTLHMIAVAVCSNQEAAEALRTNPVGSVLMVTMAMVAAVLVVAALDLMGMAVAALLGKAVSNLARPVQVILRLAGSNGAAIPGDAQAPGSNVSRHTMVPSAVNVGGPAV